MKSAVFSCLLATMLVIVGLSTVSQANVVSLYHNADSLRAALVKDWERAKVYTKEYLDAMPEDGINFKATPEIRSFAEQMLHLAQGTIGLTANGTGKDRIYQGKNLEKSDEFKNKAALIKVVKIGRASCRERV